MSKKTHIGRFAPSPTGPLHFGSLVTAVGSYLNVKSKGGRWLLRIDDLDPPREDPKAAAMIQKSLENHALEWDDKILFQSSREEPYTDALVDLVDNRIGYPCSCTKSTVKRNGVEGEFGTIYPGSCRKDPLEQNSAFYSWRVETHNDPISFTDERLGEYQLRLESQVGDFIVKRSDGVYAYHLAGVVDDAFQGITEVVRGQDLLYVTPQHVFLQQALKLPTPNFLHLPLARDEFGKKLSKQNNAASLDDKCAADNLFKVLEFLGQNPPVELINADPDDLIAWGVEHWNAGKIPMDAPQQQPWHTVVIK